jgi:mono/diheme cytochrome c family protein
MRAPNRRPGPGMTDPRPGLGWPRSLRSFAVFLLVVAAIAAGQGGPPGQAPGSTPGEPTAAAQLVRGAEVYAFSCTTCHGASGQGFAEARAAFPTDHYDCSRCHGPLNPPQMTPQQIAQTQTVFSLGRPPALADAAALERFGTAAALHAYLRTTMPRWAPGALDDHAYLDVTAFVLDLAGLLPDGAVLTPETLASIALEAPDAER